MPWRLGYHPPDLRTNFLTVEGTPRGRRICVHTQVRALHLKDCFYFILRYWRRKRVSGEPPSYILLGSRDRFWREEEVGWEGSVTARDTAGFCTHSKLLLTDPGQRGPACFDRGRRHQALHLLSQSLGPQHLGPPGIIGLGDEIWICLPLQTSWHTLETEAVPLSLQHYPAVRNLLLGGCCSIS